MSERQCVDCKEMVDISDLTEEIAELKAEIERLRGVEMKLQGTLKNQVMINDELRSRLEVAEMEVAEHERCVSSYEEEIETLRALDESLSRERDDLRSRLDAAIEPGSEEALNMLRCIEYQVEKSLGTPIWWPSTKARLRGES